MLSAMMSLAASLGVATTALPDTPAINPDPVVGRSAMLSLATPASVGMSTIALLRAEAAVQENLERGAYPGAALAIGRYGRTVLEQGFGVTGRGWGAEQV